MILSRRWFLLAAVGLAPIVASVRAPGLSVLTIGWTALLMLATIIDLSLLPRLASFEIERKVDPELSLNAANPVTVTVRNSADRFWRVRLRDEPPSAFVAEPSDTMVDAPPGRRSSITYHVRPVARGDFTFGDIWIRIAGWMGLVMVQRRIPAPQSVKVYPNLQEAAKFTLLARKGRLQQAGIRAARLVGAGREFESLRDYVPDDEYRRIDWKATARRGRLISRQYEVERSQNLVLALDVGRTMLAEIDGVAKMDYAVNAALLLAYVATLADDKVGILVFADTVQTWLPPRRGRSQVYAILEALYNARARRAEPDYRTAFAYLQSRWRRRSLVICFTDMWDAESSRRTIAELAALQPRHLVACASLMDTGVLRRAESTIEAVEDLYEQGVALQVLEDRRRATAELRRRGVLVIDSPADRFSASLVNRYLEVKERMLL